MSPFADPGFACPHGHRLVDVTHDQIPMLYCPTCNLSYVTGPDGTIRSSTGKAKNRDRPPMREADEASR